MSPNAVPKAEVPHVATPARADLPAAEETAAEFPEASEMGRREHPTPIHYHSTHRCVTAMGTGPEQQNPSEMGREICTACAVIRAEGQLPCEGRLCATTSPWEAQAPAQAPAQAYSSPEPQSKGAEEPGAREDRKDPEARKQNSGTESPGAVAKVVSVS